MKIITDKGMIITCRYCDNTAIEEFELCIKCAVIEGIEI